MKLEKTLTIVAIVNTVIAIALISMLWKMDNDALNRPHDVKMGPIEVLGNPPHPKLKRMYEIWNLQDEARVRLERFSDHVRLINGHGEPTQEEWLRRMDAEMKREEARLKLMKRKGWIK